MGFISLEKKRAEEERKRRDEMIESGEYMSIQIVLPLLDDDKMEEGYTPYIETKIKNVTHATVFGAIQAMRELSKDLCRKYPEVRKMFEHYSTECVSTFEVDMKEGGEDE